jgi:outer membrane protein OmpA-like peptidoglycan-associated protein
MRRTSRKTAEVGDQARTIGQHGQQLTAQGGQIAATSGALAATNARIANLDDYTPIKSITVYFRNGKAEVSKSDKAQLQEIAAQARNMPTYVIQVQAYASAVGPDPVNQRLSMERANNVTAVLQQSGVPLTNVVVPAAMGITDQVAPNNPNAARPKTAAPPSRRCRIRDSGTKSGSVPGSRFGRSNLNLIHICATASSSASKTPDVRPERIARIVGPPVSCTPTASRAPMTACRRSIGRGRRAACVSNAASPRECSAT